MKSMKPVYIQIKSQWYYKNLHPNDVLHSVVALQYKVQPDESDRPSDALVPAHLCMHLFKKKKLQIVLHTSFV